ncbi:hypothetical protein [Nocardioides psychrotolerans]|uniref:hypothetical protein n=1 Tax=Nocardioides psychrotolerans TaxID=1005945 RepID=UPI000B8A4710|nr:hypothetical protein [Nocardioides psychrotolerans]
MIFIDTSVFANLIEVNGNSQDRASVLEQFDAFVNSGARFVLPITTIVETGNLIFYAGGDPRPAAERLVGALSAAQEVNPPWTVRAVDWDLGFVAALIDGDSTGSSLVDLISDKRMASGDVAILVERDRFRDETAYTDVRVWSLDSQLQAFG